jgi:hypothetical protein
MPQPKLKPFIEEVNTSERAPRGSESSAAWAPVASPAHTLQQMLSEYPEPYVAPWSRLTRLAFLAGLTSVSWTAIIMGSVHCWKVIS